MIAGIDMVTTMKNVRVIIGFLLALGFWLAGHAQAQTYAYRSDVFSYLTPSATAKTVTWAGKCTTYPNGDDDYADINISSATSPANDFTFTFAGVTRTALRVYSNGIISFGTDNSGFWREYTDVPLASLAVTRPVPTGCSSSLPANILLPYWTDLISGPATDVDGILVTGASVKYELLGTKPNRQFVISWVNVKDYRALSRFNFQVILYETPTTGGNSNFKYQYSGGSSTGVGATVGVYLSSSDYTQFASDQQYIDTVTGTAILWYPSTQYVTKRAEYRFDEGVWNQTPGEVKDTAAGTESGVSVGGALSYTNGKICRGGSFPSNTASVTTSAVATPSVPGYTGSVDFWYQSAVKWNATGSDAMLLDASAIPTRPFFVMKTAAGAIQFVMTDSAGNIFTLKSAVQTIAANTWVHVGVAWTLRPGTNQVLMKIFINGVESFASMTTQILSPSSKTTSPTSNRSTSPTGAIASLYPFYIGDNRPTGSPASVATAPTNGTTQSANGLIDEVNFYGEEISAAQAMNDKNATRTTCSSIDHFHIIHTGTVVSCEAANVTIEAHDSTHQQIPLSGTQVSLSTTTNHGIWSLINGKGLVTSGTNGTATYTFSNEALVIFGLANSYDETLNINVTTGTYSEHSGVTTSGGLPVCVSQDYTYNSVCDADLKFIKAGFRFVDASGNNIANQTAALDSGTYYLQAVQNTCVTPGNCTGVCTSIFPSSTSVEVGLAVECRDPGTCVSGQTLTLTSPPSGGTAGAIQLNNSGAVTETTALSTYTTRNLTFNAVSPNPLPGAPFKLNYTDVGKIRMWARFPTDTTAPTVYGTSAEFVVKPAGFKLTEIKPTTATSGRCAVAATPAPTMTCSSVASDSAVFAKAGEAFSVTVTAVNNAGNATPNYGQESSSESVKLTPNKVVSAMTNVPSISGSFGSFTSGGATGTAFSWPEVGIITLTPSVFDADYLGAGDVSGTTSGNIGRFIPDHIKAEVSEGCGGFTYSNQPMKLTLTAESSTKTKTQNYDKDSGFARAVNLDQAQTPAVSGGFVPTNIASGDFVLGVANAKPVAFKLNIPATAPSTIRVGAALNTPDGVPLSSVIDTATGLPVVDASGKQSRDFNVRSGRLYIANACGSEYLRLPVRLETQYWTAGGWRLNDADSCTVLTDGNSGLGYGAQDARNQLASGEIEAAYGVFVAGDSGSTSATYTVSGGRSGLVLRKKNPTTDAERNSGPGKTNFGYVDIDGAKLNTSELPSLPGYPVSNWLASPGKARAVFGICGRTPVIYMRESY